jgi:peroxin-12
MFVPPLFFFTAKYPTDTHQRAFELASAPKPASNAPFTLRSLLSPSIISRIILPKILDSLKVLLPTSIFFLKFLEWWHASDFAKQLSAKTAASIELPPPIPVRPPASEEMEEEDVVKSLVKVVKENTGLCPVCEREITNPTAVQTGYVFCYPCVFRWVQDGVGRNGEEEGAKHRKGRCPVTGVRLLGGAEGLRRLMI